MTPKINDTWERKSCAFTIIDESGGLSIRNVNIATEAPSRSAEGFNAVVAVQRSIDRASPWNVEEVIVTINDTQTQMLVGSYDTECFRLAYPIDPAMTLADIEGATIIEPNATNDGWIFKHSQPCLL